jgi:hypothetical protein
MRFPVMRGTIERRILANYQVDPDVLAAWLPPPFRPQLVGGRGIAGICLIRLGGIRPRWWPAALGIGSENAAHRIAVEWDDAGGTRRGVFIPRRDTSSRLNALVGGRLFPGLHNHARFRVREANDRYSVRLDSDDGRTHVLVEGHRTDRLPADSVFGSLDEASDFFAAGSLGYSATAAAGQYDGLELHTIDWRMEPLAVERIESSFFDDSTIFPAGAVRFDSALLMRDLRHEWHNRGRLCCSVEATAGAAS